MERRWKDGGDIARRGDWFIARRVGVYVESVVCRAHVDCGASPLAAASGEQLQIHQPSADWEMMASSSTHEERVRQSEEEVEGGSNATTEVEHQSENGFAPRMERQT